jgi:hypothetical protein
MMSRKSVIAIMMIMLLIAGCTFNGAGVKIKAPVVEVGLSGGSIHCPPGQAKKGRC